MRRQGDIFSFTAVKIAISLVMEFWVESLLHATFEMWHENDARNCAA